MMQDRAGLQRRQRKTRDRALILTLVGLVLLMPPIAGVFQVPGRVFGVPLALVYLFIVWALLIAGAARLAPALLQTAEDDDEREK